MPPIRKQLQAAPSSSSSTFCESFPPDLASMDNYYPSWATEAVDIDPQMIANLGLPSPPTFSSAQMPSMPAMVSTSSPATDHVNMLMSPFNYCNPNMLSPMLGGDWNMMNMMNSLHMGYTDASDDYSHSDFSDMHAISPALTNVSAFSPLSAELETPELPYSASFSQSMLPMPVHHQSLSPQTQETVNSMIGGPDANGKWICLYSECTKRFGRKYNIHSHIQTHLSDRPFRCDRCGSCFVRAHDLRRHVKIHDENKAHICICSKGFTRMDALTRHRMRAICIGALPGYVRKNGKRGRPRKNRDDKSNSVSPLLDAFPAAPPRSPCSEWSPQPFPSPPIMQQSSPPMENLFMLKMEHEL